MNRVWAAGIGLLMVAVLIFSGCESGSSDSGSASDSGGSSVDTSGGPVSIPSFPYTIVHRTGQIPFEIELQKFFSNGDSFITQYGTSQVGGNPGGITGVDPVTGAPYTVQFYNLNPEYRDAGVPLTSFSVDVTKEGSTYKGSYPSSD